MDDTILELTTCLTHAQEYEYVKCHDTCPYALLTHRERRLANMRAGPSERRIDMGKAHRLIYGGMQEDETRF